MSLPCMKNNITKNAMKLGLDLFISSVFKYIYLGEIASVKNIIL